jgi:uncharacterized protein (DUF2267 family)
MKYDEFVKHVRERAGIEDREQAERTVETVVQLLVDRLTPDEADDLLSQLPSPLEETIEVKPVAVRMSANEFIETVAEELGNTPDEARTRARAVMETIREAVTPGEFHDVLVQLPSGFYEHIVA